MSDAISLWNPETSRLEVTIAADEYNALTKKVEALEKRNNRLENKLDEIRMNGDY